jgi:uncharacterized membrane protein
MTNISWRKRLSIWRSRLYLYPPPEPMQRTWMYWLATGLVALLVLLFSGFFILYLTGRQAAIMTNAEDLGIMDQAVWSTIHGQLLHQTVCNILHDTNCYSINGITRFAIHFEPMLFPVSLLYFIWSGPDTLLILQVLVVASGAFPAFWLARLRLRNDLAGVAIAFVYLLYPAQQYALVNDFHAVAFTASLLLFTLFFMYTRRTVWLFVFAILSMACKEEIPLTIFMFGLWSILFQQRYRCGSGLILIALAWIGLYFVVVHFYSPTGHPLLASRYSYLGSIPFGAIKTIIIHPGMIIKQHVLEHNHLFYLRLLLNPAGYLPILAPWVLIMDVPAIAINLLSTDPNMYSGMFQYNAEIVPVLIFSTIEAIVLLVWLAQQLLLRVQYQRAEKQHGDALVHASSPQMRQQYYFWVRNGLSFLLLFYAIFSVVRANTYNKNMPFGQGFSWPQITPHTALAQKFIDMIPPTASVSAQSSLVPHLSERSSIYLFPYADNISDYIFLDVTSDIYPFYGSGPYIDEVKKVLLSGNYGIIAAQDGYLLLKRGATPPGISPHSPFQAQQINSQSIYDVQPNLPSRFCSYVDSSPAQVIHPLQATFSSPDASNTMNLIGYNVSAPQNFSLSSGYMQVTTYWKTAAPTTIPLQAEIVITDKNGVTHFGSSDFPAFAWCQTNTWKPGSVVNYESSIFQISGIQIPNGIAHVSLVLLPLTQPSSKMLAEQDWLSVKLLQAQRNIAVTNNNKALQLASITIVP